MISFLCSQVLETFCNILVNEKIVSVSSQINLITNFYLLLICPLCPRTEQQESQSGHEEYEEYDIDTKLTRLNCIMAT
jgi:hypothetical protein